MFIPDQLSFPNGKKKQILLLAAYLETATGGVVSAIDFFTNGCPHEGQDSDCFDNSLNRA